MLQATADIITELRLLSFEKSKNKYEYVPKDRRLANTLCSHKARGQSTEIVEQKDKLDPCQMLEETEADVFWTFKTYFGDH